MKGSWAVGAIHRYLRATAPHPRFPMSVIEENDSYPDPHFTHLRLSSSEDEKIPRHITRRGMLGLFSGGRPTPPRPASPTESHVLQGTRNVSVESSSPMNRPSSSSPRHPRLLNRHAPYRRQSTHSHRDSQSEGENSELDAKATDDQKKLHKRRQNTLAARRSRAKRVNELQALREENQRLREDNAALREEIASLTVANARLEERAEMTDMLARKGIKL